MISTIQQLTNAGSKLLNINGATTPKTFSYTATSASELVTGFICILKDEGNTSFSNFGAKTALTNGISIQTTQAGVTRTIATIKDNADLCMTFSNNQFGNGAVLSILSVATPEGFGDTNNCFVGSFEPHHHIDLVNGDTISVIIQDNLSGVGVFQISCRVCKD